MTKMKNLNVLYIKCIVLTFCLSIWQNVSAQNIVARPFPFFYQLYSNEVFDIYQDRTGYLWFGMSSALARYDGHCLRNFRSAYKTPNLLVNNRIVYLTDNDRYVWVSTGGGVTLYDKQTWRTTKVVDKRIDGHSITDIATDTSTEEVWVAAGNHVFRCSPDGKQVEAYLLQKNIPDEGLRQLYVDRENRIWAMSYYGLFGYDKAQKRFVRYPTMPDGATPFTMLQDRLGNYWIGTWGDGLWHFNPKASSPDKCYQRQVVKLSGSNMEDKVFFSMAQDDVYGYLWMLSYNELHAFKYQDGKLIPIDISHIIDPHKMFTMILKDREGNLWLGSYDMGYTIYFDHSGVVSYPMPHLKELLSYDANILNLGYDGEGVLWMGQDRYGLLLYDLKTGKITSESHLGLGEISIMKRSPKGGIWLRPRSQNRIVKAVRTSARIQLTENIDMYSLLANPGNVVDMNEDKAGNLWILTTTNLYVHKPHASTLFAADKDVLRPEAFVVDDHGYVWGVKGRNVYQFSFNGQDIVAKQVGNIDLLHRTERIEHLCVDKLGALWLTTSLSRMVRSNRAKTKYFSLNTEQLMDGPILSILSNRNKVWVLTNKKVVSIDIFTHKDMAYEANSENIAVKAFRSSALCSDLKGGVFVGGHDGVVHVKQEQKKQMLPKGFKFRVSDVLSNGVSMLFDNPDTDSREGTVYLPSDSRNVEICVSSLLYSPGVLETVQYKLEGVDPDWVNLNDRNSSASYISLPRGKHRFLVRWQKPDGSWSESQNIMLLVRRPAFYESNLAFVVYGLLTLLVVYYIVCVIRRRANLSALRHYHNQARLERLMEENAQEAGNRKIIDHSHEPGEKAQVANAISCADKVFVKNMMDLIEQHISDSEYGQEQLARDLLLSRSTLYRKIKAVSGMSPLDFMRNVKMKKACVMLSQHEMSISEIAYSLGFTNPKYFTKCFKEEMGQTPSEYQKQN